MISSEECADLRERLARVEENGNNRDKRLARIENKLDGLLQSANMGRGAWLALLRVGAFLVAVGGAVAWVVDHLQKRT